MASRAAELRNVATQCMEIARRTTDSTIREDMLSMARRFHQLAQHIEEKGEQAAEGARKRAAARVH